MMVDGMDGWMVDAICLFIHLFYTLSFLLNERILWHFC